MLALTVEIREMHVLGQVDSGSNSMSEIRSVNVAPLSAVEDIKKLVHQDFLGVRPTELCTCSENALRENTLSKPCRPRLRWWTEGCKSKCRGKKLDHRKEVIMTLP